jgi:GntR family transcriptional regulator / MocR family aminotransferase
MSPWSFPIHLETSAAEPIYLQIARAIREDILRGRLGPGDPLPGSRTLAGTLGVHRNTILAALRELQAEGWLQSLRHSIRIAEEPPRAPQRPRSVLPMELGFPLAAPASPALPRPPGKPGLLVFGSGLPDLRLLPTEPLARAYGRALRNKALMGYGDPRGELRLRIALTRLLSEVRGLALEPERLMVVGGSQMGLDLAARTLLVPGDVVAVEDPGYAPAWATLRAVGAELVPVPVDGGGLQVEALEALLHQRPLRALYCTPHHQFPTTVTLEPQRRLHLLELARAHQLAILEDDYDFEFHFDGNPVLPLASGDRAGVVVYMGSLSKVVAPGLRLGFVAGPGALIDALAARRYTADRQGDQVLERAVAELLEDGLLQRHVRKVHRIYHARRTVLAQELERHLAGIVGFRLPPGGMSLWLQTEPSLDVEAWAHRAEHQGVRFHPGRRYDFSGATRPNMRLGFSALDEEELQEAVQRMKRAL